MSTQVTDLPPKQGNLNSSLFPNSKRERSERAPRLLCKRHLPLKMHREVSFLLLSYYSVSFQSALSLNPPAV